jgi:hypothetical protein
MAPISPSSALWKLRQAGGIDPTEDVAPMLPALASSMGTFSSYDICHATYVFDYLASDTNDSRVKMFASSLATEYARRFAEWLGYVFLNRANLTQQSKAMKALQEALGDWVEAIPSMLTSKPKPPSEFVPAEATKFLKLDRIDALGQKVVRVVWQDWVKNHTKTAMSEMEQMPITFNSSRHVYEIPKSNLTYTNRTKLRDLGFEFDGTVWFTKILDTRVLQQLPQAAQLVHTPPAAKPMRPAEEPKDWFFKEWLPGNIDRFTKAFNEYGKAEKVPYSFKFQVHGTEVTVNFQRDIHSIPDAIRELESRYGSDSDRDGWMEAISSYHNLQSASGKAAIHAVDRANNLEHSHGAMMEHFPPGVRTWYPRFLDFKYTAGIWQMIRAIRDEDMRVVASELMPMLDRMQRLAPKPTDYRTPKGLVLEITSQPGKAAKKRMLKEVMVQHPELAHRILAMLDERGIDLGVKLEDVGLGSAFKLPE